MAMINKDYIPLEVAILRHANANWPLPGETDFNRKLSARGQDEASRSADFLTAQGFKPTKAVTSPAVRCVETLEIVMKTLGGESGIHVEPNLYLSSADDYIATISEHRNTQRMLLVGHNPTLEELIERLVGHEIYTQIAPFGFQTSAIAIFTASFDSAGNLHSVRLNTSFEP